MIDILLATYNSEKYLQEQLDSIIGQDCDDWKLIIRDGGSSDNTQKIINEYCLSYPQKIKSIISQKRSTAIENFSALLEASDASYIMFSDHDDVWMKIKCRKTFEKMTESEERFGSNTPLLVFTDKQVVDCNLKHLSNSCFNYQKLNPLRTRLNNLLTQNIPTANTMLFNRALADVVKDIHPKAIMHDHWVSLVAAAFGEIIYLNEATLLYRQHGENVFGANAYGWSYFYQKYKSGLSNVRKHFYLSAEQAKAFQQQYGKMLSENDNRMLNEFSNIEEKSFLERRRILWKYKIYKSGWRRNIGSMLII